MRLWRLGPDEKPEVLERGRYPVRLGASTFAAGRLSPALIDAATDVMAEIRRMADDAGCREIRAVGTSALRTASNAADLVARVQEKTGIAVEVISPAREGALTAKGALSSLSLPAASRVTVLDIGGGSGEVITAEIDTAGHIAATETLSLPVGAVRLTEAFLPSDPPTADEIAALERHLAETLDVCDLRPREGAVVGCGGTMVSVRNMIRRRGNTAPESSVSQIAVADLRSLMADLIPLRIEVRMARHRIEHQRAEIIVAGAKALEALLARLGVDEIHVTKGGLREGLLAEFLESPTPE